MNHVLPIGSDRQPDSGAARLADRPAGKVEESEGFVIARSL
jgi:hypothetical protein